MVLHSTHSWPFDKRIYKTNAFLIVLQVKFYTFYVENEAY